NALYVFSDKPDRKTAITRIDFATGESKTQETIPTPVERQFVAEVMPTGALPTAAYLLHTELATEEERKRAMRTVYSQFVSAGPNAVEMQVRMVQPNLVEVKAMKDKGPSQLNATTSASTSAGLVAEEIFNDIKRSNSRTGGFKTVDESRYRVTLRRFLAENAEPWSGEVVGPPAFFPMKTVDVLLAGKMAYVFDKQNRKLFETKLTYEGAENLIRASGRSPFLEENNVLYFFDQGFLTAAELPSGNIRWRVTSVGISKIQSDGNGHLYVNSTTASPEDIQYSEQIKIQDVTKPVLLKIKASNGEVLWRSSNLADCRISGKYVYATTQQTSAPALAGGLAMALGSYVGGEGKYRVFRIDPDNGKRKWEYFAEGMPEGADFQSTRILLQYEDQVQFLKYFSF
ncbi:MAG: PQQ-binding-like beta-propeller repeat protein, partial [Limisphaerales bacterium]